MASYKAPLRDMRFVLLRACSASRSRGAAGLRGRRPPTSSIRVLEEAAKLCENVLFPLNRTGDEEGCTYENGVVRTPKGFKDAYDMFREGGWTGRRPAIPSMAARACRRRSASRVQEMFTRVEPGLRACIPASATAPTRRWRATARTSSRRRYLPKLADGTWTGTMCLTEPHCGTDLGMLRTKAEPQADGSYSITGTKIFISAGEHDLDREHHPPRAGAPAGCAGGHQGHLAVPGAEVPAQGRRQRRASATASAAARIEHKMGIKAIGDLRHELRRRQGLAGRRAATRACAACS